MRRDNGAALDGGQASAAAGGAKGMMPFARPFLDYVLSVLADTGITEAVLVIGPPPEDAAIREYFAATEAGRRVSIRFAVQPEPRGTADALYAARDVVRPAPFLMLNSDNYYPLASCSALAAIGGAGLVAFDADTLVRESGIEAERVLRYALVDADSDGWLRAIYEKPDPDHPLAQSSQRWVSMNLWSFTPRIFDACARVVPSARGELELQDAVTIAMRDFENGFACMPSGAVLDLSSAPMWRSWVRTGDHLAATVTPSVIRRYVVPDAWSWSESMSTTPVDVLSPAPLTSRCTSTRRR
jgi:glucose-1-phosphate thymidylyltransferase